MTILKATLLISPTTLAPQQGLPKSSLLTLFAQASPASPGSRPKDYDRHSMPMLKRIADAMNLRLSVALVPADDEEPELA